MEGRGHRGKRKEGVRAGIGCEEGCGDDGEEMDMWDLVADLAARSSRDAEGLRSREH